MAKSGKKSSPGSIAQNRRARHDYFIEDKFEAGLMLMGWEVKSIRNGKVQLAEAFVQIHKGEAYLAGCTITPLLSASTHVVAEPQRMRKLLLHAKELSRLFIASQQKGYTIVPLAMYWRISAIEVIRPAINPPPGRLWPRRKMNADTIRASGNIGRAIRLNISGCASRAHAWPPPR